MPSGPACYQALEGVLPWLPLVLALSVNSPYLEGRETGHCSSRAELLAELPRSGAPPVLGSYAGWEEYVARFVSLGLATDETTQWWDVRPSRRFGTLEVRMPDQPTAIELSGAFAALAQALCVAVLRLPPRPADPPGRGIYQQNRWAALHDGPRAELVHPDEDRLVAVPELAAELLELIGPAVRELGTEGLVAALDPGTCEADGQLQVGRSEGLRALCSALVAGTLGSR
jgi:carboxylate-amine ligase